MPPVVERANMKRIDTRPSWVGVLLIVIASNLLTAFLTLLKVGEQMEISNRSDSQCIPVKSHNKGSAIKRT